MRSISATVQLHRGSPSAARVVGRDGAVLHVFDAPSPLVVEAGLQTRGTFFMPHTWRVSSRRQQANAECA